MARGPYVHARIAKLFWSASKKLRELQNNKSYQGFAVAHVRLFLYRALTMSIVSDALR